MWWEQPGYSKTFISFHEKLILLHVFLLSGYYFWVAVRTLPSGEAAQHEWWREKWLFAWWKAGSPPGGKKLKASGEMSSSGRQWTGVKVSMTCSRKHIRDNHPCPNNVYWFLPSTLTISRSGVFTYKWCGLPDPGNTYPVEVWDRLAGSWAVPTCAAFILGQCNLNLSKMKFCVKKLGWHICGIELVTAEVE